jgi:hypothetical protein
MTMNQAWIEMCADFLEDNPEAEGLLSIELAITGGQGGGMWPKPLTAVSLARYLESLADAHDTWRQIVGIMTQDSEDGDEIQPMWLGDLICWGLESKYEDRWMPRMGDN